jgi:hypothetical protein
MTEFTGRLWLLHGDLLQTAWWCSQPSPDVAVYRPQTGPWGSNLTLTPLTLKVGEVGDGDGLQ